MRKLILFDIDGTMISGKYDNPDSFSDAIKAVHNIDVEISWGDIQGMTDPQILKETLLKNGISKKNIKQNMSRYFDEMSKSFQRSVKNREMKPLDGVKELLISLKSKSIVLGLVTGNLSSIAKGKLEKIGLLEYFDIGSFGDDDINRTKLVKLAIKRAGTKFKHSFRNKIVIIGDSPSDIKAGLEAGIQTIGVATGKYSKKTLQEAGANAAVDSLKDTNKIIRLIDGLIL